jgi:hypothetical protein
MRAEAVAGLRKADVSVATLAQMADCSAASIRRLEAIDQLSPELKARIRGGEPSDKLVALAKALRLIEVFGIPPIR